MACFLAELRPRIWDQWGNVYKRNVLIIESCYWHINLHAGNAILGNVFDVSVTAFPHSLELRLINKLEGLGIVEKAIQKTWIL